MPPPSKKSSYQQLRDKWYKKLKDKGFADIEQDEDTLKAYHKSIFGRPQNANHFGGWQAKAEYYQLAEQFLREYKFETVLQKVVWEYHANGLTYREIAQTLKKAGVKRVSHVMAFRMIATLKAKMFDMYLAKAKAYYE